MRQQRQHSPERRSRKFKYSFEAIIDQVRINVKFPCRIAVSWNYGDGQVKTSSSRQLMNGTARFDENLMFTTTIGFDEESQKYHELKSTVEISIITDNGTSLAGFVPIDLGNVINRKDRKELFQIQRCPDKAATVRMRISYRFLADNSKPKNRVKLLGSNSGEDSDFQEGNRSVTPRSQYMPKTQYVIKKTVVKQREQPPHTNRNKELIEKELLVLKGRVTEFQGKYKNQRGQKEKLAEVLKGKEQVFFTMKTQIKRKQIELEDVYRSLEEYRSEYERIKLVEESTRRESDKVVKSLQTSERLLQEKIVKLETEAIGAERRIEKGNLQIQRLKKEKDNLLVLQKERNDESHKDKEALNQAIRVLKRQREESSKQSRIEKESLERNLRQMTKNHKEVSDELELVRIKLGATEKKMVKFEESRTEEFHKFNARINELDKAREALMMENQVLKSSIAKKQISWIEAAKGFDARINEEKAISATVKTQLTEVQFDRATLQKDLAITKQALRGSDQDCKRLDKQCSILKGQISALTEQLQARNAEIKGLNLKTKDLQDQIQRQAAQLQQAHEDSVNDLSSRLKEVKKSEQSKNAATMKILTRKEKQLEEALAREQKLLSQIDTLKQQAKRSEQQQKQRADNSKKLENNLRLEIQELVKKSQKTEEQLTLRLESVSRQLLALEEAFGDQKDILARTTQRQLKFKHEVQSLTQQMVYAEENKQLLAQYEDKLKENDKTIDELFEDIRNREVKQLQLTKMVSDLKDKLMESDGDRAKKDSLIKEKDKLLNTSSKQAALELDEKKRELARRQTEIKILHDEMRDSLKRQRSKQDELSIQNERLNNELSVGLANLDSCGKNLEQLQIELKNIRDNERSLLLEKQQLLRSRQEGELYRREVEQLRLMMDENLANKEKDLKSLRQQNAELDRSYTELNKMYIRNNLMVEELVDLANKLSGISISSTSSILNKDMTSSMVKSINLSDYDKLLELRKLLVVAEGRWRKQLEIVSDREQTRIKEKQKDQNDIEKLNADVQRFRGEIIRMKKDNQELIYNSDFMKIENQQLLYKLQGVEGELGSAKNAISHFEGKVKELLHDLERSDADNKQLQARYEGLLEQVRVTLTEKAQKQKKQLTATIRKHETRIEELEQKTFQLELENQKVGQLTKREQQNKKILARIFELERQNMHLTQSSNQKVDKVQNDYEKLLWEKKTIEDNLKNTVVKFERTLTNNQQELERANTKTKEVAQQLRDKQIQLTKTEQSLQRLQFEMNTLKISSQDDKEKLTALDGKYKSETTKLKADLTSIRKQFEQQREQLANMQNLKLTKAALEEELAAKQKAIAELQDKHDKLSDEVLKLTQRIDQLKWQSDQKIEAKDNEIIGMQEHLYSMNSKENMRLLRENEQAERYRQLENEKKTLSRDLYQYKVRWQDAQEKNRQLMLEKKDLDDFVRNPKRTGGDINEKYDEVLKTFEREITELREENEELRESHHRNHTGM